MKIVELSARDQWKSLFVRRANDGAFWMQKLKFELPLRRLFINIVHLNVSRRGRLERSLIGETDRHRNDDSN